MTKWMNAIAATCIATMVAVWLTGESDAVETPASAPSTLPATQETGPEVERFTLYPSATAQPALQYRLLPDLVDQSPGNAAPLYAIASDLLSTAGLDKVLDDFLISDKVLLPPAQLAHDEETASILAKCAEGLRYVELAARRDDARWDNGLREFGIDARMPQLNQMRLFTNIVAVQVKAQAGRGDFHAALRTMQTMFSMSRQLGRRPTLVEGLVAMGIADMTLDSDVEAWVGVKHAPNLYWALSSLPRPYVNCYAVALTERSQIYFQCPLLRQAAEGKELSADQWREIMRELMRANYTYTPSSAPPGSTTDWDSQVGRVVAAAAPQARQYLVSTGMTKQKAEAVPEDQAVGVYLFHQYRIASDEVWKAWELPYRQSIHLIRQANQLAEREAMTGNRSPFLGTIDRIWRAKSNFELLDRRIAFLRTIEALRDYLARHGGQFPERLDQITDLPVPIDPITNTPFSYRRDGTVAILEAAVQEGSSRSGWRFEMTVAK